jgi:pimeloyl-ACP methyl ester carboxylesterase
MEHPALAARLRELVADNVGYVRSMLRHGDVERSAEGPTADRVRTIRVPVLLIVGSRDVPDIQRIVLLLATRIPGARVVKVAGAGHMVNMEQPARFTAVVREFLGSTGVR